MKKPKLLVTGGCGFIGSNFILETIDDYEQVVNLDAITYAGNTENLRNVRDRYKLVRGDVRDRPLVRELLRELEPDCVVHFAAESHVDRSIDSPGEFVQTNVVGTFHLLEEVRGYVEACGKQESFRFLHISTDEVFGSLGPNDPPFSETTPFAPNSPYSATKAASDHLVRSYFHTYGLPVLTSNCSNNYGPFQFPEKLIPLIILNAASGKPLPVYGDGQNIRDWLYVRDHCRALRLILRLGKPGSTYTVGGGNEMKNIDVVRIICSILDELRPASKPHSSLIQFVKDRPGHDRRYAVNSDRLKKETGWKQEESFETGIRRTVEWYLNNESWIASCRARS
jgi:dTDP-glucose 4,6-dehydratase